MVANSSNSMRHLVDAVLLNRTVYGGADDLPAAFLADYDAARDPDAVGNRSALNVYDRYDNYLQSFGFKTLSSGELGFAAARVSASEATDGLDQNYTYRGDLFRNNFQISSAGAEVPFTNAGAVAISAVKETPAGRELHLALRGTDADLGADGEAGTGPGQVRYYEQLKGIIDQVYAFAANAANGIKEVVVSGHSLGGAMADLFALYDGARFASLQGVELSVVALASAGVDPVTLALRPDYDRSLVTLGTDGVRLTTPDWYLSYDNAGDIVRNPARYDAVAHAKADPEQAPVTAGAVSTLREHLHFDAHRLTVETPLINQYVVSANLQTNFLALHYASYYELIGTEISKAAALGADVLSFERVVALNGTNPEAAKTPGTNDANGFGLPINDRYDDLNSTKDMLAVGLNGHDWIQSGSGNDFLFGGEGSDQLKGGGGADTLFGGNGADQLYGGSEDDVLRGGADGDFLYGGANNDTLYGDAGDDLLDGLTGDDTLWGGAGNDFLLGSDGNDLLYGEDGNDRLDGGRGADQMFGRAGDDTYTVDNRSDMVVENDNAPGSGKDSVFTSMSYTLTANVESLNLSGNGNIDGTGNGLANRIRGNDGNNVLTGLGGQDIVTGGGGADTFAFLAAEAGSRDRILDFSRAQGDMVGIDGVYFGLMQGDDLAAGRFVARANITQGTVAGEGQFLFDTASRTLFWDADGAQSGNAVALAGFDNTTLTADDFMVV